MKNFPVISVVVPVYNTEPYLYCCIDSILSQTFTDFELLLIDDGSTDRSGVICDEYASKDKRIRAFHKENGGVSSARNKGLDEARGEWIAFVDSDDWTEPNYLMDLFTHISDKIDLVISYPKVYMSNFVCFEDSFSSYMVLEKELFWRLFVENDLTRHVNPWGKLYRKSIIEENRIRFYEQIHWGEDAVFLFSFMLHVYGVYVLGVTNYCYRNEIENSLSRKINSVDSEYLGYKKICEVINELSLKKCLNTDSALVNLNRLIACFIWRVLNSLYHNLLCREKRMEIMKSLDLSLISYFDNCSIETCFLKFLLKHRMLLIYDIMRSFKKLYVNREK